MVKGRQMIGQFMRWIARRDKKNLIEVKFSRGSLRGAKVPRMDGIKCSAEECDVQ